MDCIWITFDINYISNLYGTDKYLLAFEAHNIVLFLQMFVGNPGSENYARRQSMWNIVSAAKSVFVSYIILSNR